MHIDLSGKVAAITGGARGIGAAAARALSEAGASIALLDTDIETAQLVAGSLTHAMPAGSARFGALALHADVTREASLEAALARVIDLHGRLDILVNSAGIAARTPSVDLSVEDWQRVQDVNLKGTFLAARIAARQMKKQRDGSIVNIASVMGFSGGIFPNASYQASKGAVVNLTRALALEWAADGIRVNAVGPTYVRTDLTAPLFANPEAMKAIMAHAPLGFLPEPADVAAAVVFLASPLARCITGHTLPVDCGYLAR